MLMNIYILLNGSMRCWRLILCSVAVFFSSTKLVFVIGKSHLLQQLDTTTAAEKGLLVASRILFIVSGFEHNDHKINIQQKPLLVVYGCGVSAALGPFLSKKN